MRTIVARRAVACPYHLAQEYLEAELVKDVDVTIERGVDELFSEQPWKVRWSPHGGGPYPDFTGTLTVCEDLGDHCGVLDLVGSYEAPFGTAGQMFDAIAGGRIAQATAESLLFEIGTHIEARFRRSSSGKVRSVAAAAR